MKIGLLKEGKNPPDKRVPFSPDQCEEILTKFAQVSIYAHPSPLRCFSDSEYKKKGVVITDDLSMCDVIMGIKEVPLHMLLDNKIFLFFSHTIKKQPYNRELLKKIIEKNIQLVDYETIVDENHKRIIGFGRYAGIVGAYNTFLAYGRKSKKYNLKFAHLLKDKRELEKELLKVNLPSNYKIVLTGSGRVASGAIEVLDFLNIQKVSVGNFVNQTADSPCFVQLKTSDYYTHKDGQLFVNQDFYNTPDNYVSCLASFCQHAHMLITGHYHAPGNPILLTQEEIRKSFLFIDVVGDISCDIAGPIGSTIRPSTISSPLYGYDKISGLEADYMNQDSLVVMAVDNLPCSLPQDASIDFGHTFINKILPDLLSKQEIISRATITKNGKLTSRYNYLSDYIN